jgi:hypothetical protein
METNIVVQHRETKCFLSEENAWNNTASLARRFKNSLEALRFCVSKGLRNIDVVVNFPDRPRAPKNPGLDEKQCRWSPIVHPRQWGWHLNRPSIAYL